MIQVISKALQFSMQYMFFTCQILPQVINIGLLVCQPRRHMSTISNFKGAKDEKRGQKAESKHTIRLIDIMSQI